MSANFNPAEPGYNLNASIKLALDSTGVFTGVPPTNFTTLPKWFPPTDITASLDVRMHSYIAAQCSQCHGARGEVEGQDINYDYHAMIDYSSKGLVGLDSTIGRYTTIMVPDCFDVKMVYKGDPEASSLYYRMTQRSVDPLDYFPVADQMPPATSFVTDSDALSMTHKWICEMDPALCALKAAQKKAGSTHEKCPEIKVDNPSR